MERKKHKANQDAAVALRYKAGMDTAPRVVAKGRNYLAKRIIEIAHEHNVPVFVDAQLAQLLYGVVLDRTIPEQLYQLVAEVLAWVYSVDAASKDKVWR